tara:strand:- start:202 stop:2340 length:2139 start_codon:yes stop_codon:yes gene_type:complete
VDTKLNFISYSNQWLSDFTDNKVDIEGKHLFDAIPEMPKVFITAVELALKGKENINDGQKFISSSGRVQWLKWKVLPLKIDENVFGGLVIFLEDITTHQKEIELHNKTGSVARTGGWEVNLQTNTVYWTKTTREIHEVDEDFEPDLAQGINFYKEGIHREKITKLVGSAIEEGTPWDIELVIITAKGNEVWVRAIGEVEMLDNKVIRIIGTFQDIDVRKKLELAHEEISERLKIATQTAQIGIWEYDIENNQLIWDDNMYLLYGIQENEFTGVYEAWQAGVHPYDMERGSLEIQQAISGEKEFDTEFRVMWPNGEIKHLKAFAKTIKDSKGKTVKLIGTNWDITELRSTELQLEKSKDSFTETFNNAAIGMALVSLKGNWIKVNSSLCKSLGYTEKEFFKLTFQDITHPEDINADLKLLSEVIEGKRESYQLEKRYIHKNSQLVYAILTVTVVREINGDISHFVSQVLDITERIEGEKKLETLVEVTKNQNESLMNFAHIVSHNLRSHSTNMTMLAKFLLQEEDEEELKNINRMISDAAESLSETILHLNDVVQVKTGTLENLQSSSVLNTIEHIKKSIGGLLEEQDAIVKINIEKSHFVNAIPSYLESIFLNILTNAIKYSSPDRIPVIEIKSKIQKETVLITFKDNGQGIDLNRHGDKIFGMYKTFHKHKDAKGIGLFITKNQIEAMGGSIKIESAVDQGTTIFIELKKS